MGTRCFDQHQGHPVDTAKHVTKASLLGLQPRLSLIGNCSSSLDSGFGNQQHSGWRLQAKRKFTSAKDHNGWRVVSCLKRLLELKLCLCRCERAHFPCEKKHGSAECVSLMSGADGQCSQSFAPFEQAKAIFLELATRLDNHVVACTRADVALDNKMQKHGRDTIGEQVHRCCTCD